MMTGLFTVMCFITSANAPEWEIVGGRAEVETIEQQVSDLPGTIVRRTASPGGKSHLWFKLPGELRLRDINGLVAELNRAGNEAHVPPSRPFFCPYGGADRWREGVAGPPWVGIFGSPAEVERVRAANPNWAYEDARNVDGRTGLHFTPGMSEDDQASYAEFLSQVHAEFEGIDVVLVEQVPE